MKWFSLTLQKDRLLLKPQSRPKAVKDGHRCLQQNSKMICAQNIADCRTTTITINHKYTVMLEVCVRAKRS